MSDYNQPDSLEDQLRHQGFRDDKSLAGSPCGPRPSPNAVILTGLRGP
jgi:hypothetical protein